MTNYLVDSYNHTGYSQVMEETSGSDRLTFTIGDDVLTQSNFDGTTTTTRHLLYDGQGSTRQLINSNSSLADSYSYDSYGVMLGGSPTPAAPALTNLLYTGEQWDNNAQHYYLRARYYNPLNGLFNQTDPYAGNMQDPQSLHKYLYCHNNPVNAIDPSGAFISLMMGFAFRLAFTTLDLMSRCLPALVFATEIAWSATFASAIMIVLEQTGFIPQSGYMEEIFAVSLTLATFGTAAIMYANTLRSIIEPLSGSRGQIISANTANQRSIALNPNYSQSPPYKSGSLAAEGEFIRDVYQFPGIIKYSVSVEKPP